MGSKRNARIIECWNDGVLDTRSWMLVGAQRRSRLRGDTRYSILDDVQIGSWRIEVMKEKAQYSSTPVLHHSSSLREVK
jgi:hypothetical protein